MNGLSRSHRSLNSVMHSRMHGFTLIELLVAASILTVGCAGFLSAWMYSVRRSQQTATEIAAQQCARLVMERVKCLGYMAPPGMVPQTLSRWPNDSSHWQSPAYQAYKYFDAGLNEIGSSDTIITPPAGAAFQVTTQLSYSGLKPTGRDDLDQMTIIVTVQEIGPNGVVTDGPPGLKSVVSIGGL